MVELRIDDWLVGIRPDTESTAARLRRFFAPYLIDGDERVRSNFSIRSPHLRPGRGRGELYIAGDVAVRSRRFGPLVHAMASHIAGAVAPRGGAVRTRARVFRRGDRAVLVEAPRSARVMPRGREVAELMTWDPVIFPSARSVWVPPPLTGLRWEAAGLPEPASPGRQLELVGLVLPPGAGGRPDIARLWVRSTGPLDDWALLLNDLDVHGRIRTAPTASDARREVSALLS